MATLADVRRVAVTFPGVEAIGSGSAFGVLNKGTLKKFVWVWQERVEPKKPRVPNPHVVAVRVTNNAAKDLMLASEPAKFFTEPHYNGFPAVLVRLESVSVSELRMLIEEAWRCQAPPELAGNRRPRAGTRRTRS